MWKDPLVTLSTSVTLHPSRDCVHVTVQIKSLTSPLCSLSSLLPLLSAPSPPCSLSPFSLLLPSLLFASDRRLGVLVRIGSGAFDRCFGSDTRTAGPVHSSTFLGLWHPRESAVPLSFVVWAATVSPQELVFSGGHRT